MIGYKTCYKTPSGDFVSSSYYLEDSKYCIRYEIGKKAIPGIGCIFAFSSLVSARLHIRNLQIRQDEYVCLEAEIELYHTQFKVVPNVCSQNTDKIIEDFWNKAPGYEVLLTQYNGVMLEKYGDYILCESITPIRVIE
jgi:hypothetical protein